MDVFDLRDRLIRDYREYALSFVKPRDERVRSTVETAIDSGALWPDPLIQMNPAFAPGGDFDELVRRGVLHAKCNEIFRKDKEKGSGSPLQLYRHQVEAIEAARRGANYVLTTGTGSGKSLSYIVPIVDHVLRVGSGRGIQAIVVYPMNALANSQKQELEKFLKHGFAKSPVTFARYTGQEDDDERQLIQRSPPDILLTNFMMLEYVMTRPYDKQVVDAAQALRFLVLDELHTYRGRQGADVAMLVRRLRERVARGKVLCVGTSATMSSKGTFAERQQDVAAVASRIFGVTVEPSNVIGETLRRQTPERNSNDRAFVDGLRTRLEQGSVPPVSNHAEFIASPMASWLESTFGVVAEASSDRLVRQQPRSISGPLGAGASLSKLTGVAAARCEESIRQWLLAGYECIDPWTSFPTFAFRLHQFLSPGNQVYASPESESARYLTLNAQQFVPGNRDRVLLPLVFCRECGQEYYAVRRRTDDPMRGAHFAKRDLGDRDAGDGNDPGFLYISFDAGWPEQESSQIDRVPEDWLEEHQGRMRIMLNRRDKLPQSTNVLANGDLDPDGQAAWFLPSPFSFCLRCGVAYDTITRSDFGKLYSFGFEGRSTATTVLCLTAVRAIKEAKNLGESARKLLSFTDNRQDASLQAGHFNDFVSIGLIRAALFRAIDSAGPSGLDHAALPGKVFDALALDIQYYASDPTVRFAAKTDTERALRELLEYRIYRDLERDWRVTAPNLEQCGLLEIEYQSLTDLCRDQAEWVARHGALAGATPETRERICKTLLDFLRRSLAIYVDCLNPERQEQIKSRSRQKLNELWGIDDNELLRYAATALPRARRGDDRRDGLFLSGRGSFGRFLRRSTTFVGGRPPTVPECDQIIRDLFETLKVAGLVKEVRAAEESGQVPGYQIPASAMTWRAGDGSRAFHDPIRVTTPPADGPRANPYFVNHYRKVSLTTAGLEAREHTAQVPADERIKREGRFRTGQLPVMFCSPTMELGVDIRDLNAVNMRNVPPTPANYAQRSGRAGRSGQPALVFTYCSRGNSHDQYFFKRPERMVAGVVEPPRLDLVNEDLVRSHIHAIWLAETGESLGTSLVDLLEMSGAQPSLAVIERIQHALQDQHALARTRARALRLLDTIAIELAASGWFGPDWLEREVLAQIPNRFESACGRWRDLYRAASRSRDAQNEIIKDNSRVPRDRDNARRLRGEAEAQIELLRDSKNVGQSDFYSYRYFASEGFLPGYNFPRLPLSAFIPGRTKGDGRQEFLSRPRFLAISEFGPSAVVYHEGARYVVKKVMLSLDERGLALASAKICGVCGYLHPQGENGGTDVCTQCGTQLGAPTTSLFRMQNVVTRRRERISSDEEERQRQGFEIQTTIQFQSSGGRTDCVGGEVEVDGHTFAHLAYGHAADIWRINRGWTRRNRDRPDGFDLDIESGKWESNAAEAEDAEQDPLGPRIQRVIPFVSDHRNSLLFTPVDPLEPAQMASLQAALKIAIQTRYQLEDSELAAEPLPTPDLRRCILFFEASEGGAGVLRRLIDDADALAEVARTALDLCHFDAKTGEDRRRGPRATEDCEAACYDCLLTYSNQRDHPHIDRKQIVDTLLSLSRGRVTTAPGGRSVDQHIAELKKHAGSDLERQWVDYVADRGHHLPDDGQATIAPASTKPDFIYHDDYAVVYVDGPPHDYPDRQERDRAQTSALQDLGYTVVRFHHRASWDEILRKYPSVFGKSASGPGPSA